MPRWEEKSQSVQGCRFVARACRPPCMTGSSITTTWPLIGHTFVLEKRPTYERADLCRVADGGCAGAVEGSKRPACQVQPDGGRGRRICAHPCLPPNHRPSSPLLSVSWPSLLGRPPSTQASLFLKCGKKRFLRPAPVANGCRAPAYACPGFCEDLGAKLALCRETWRKQGGREEKDGEKPWARGHIFRGPSRRDMHHSRLCRHASSWAYRPFPSRTLLYSVPAPHLVDALSVCVPYHPAHLSTSRPLRAGQDIPPSRSWFLPRESSLTPEEAGCSRL